MKFKKIIGYSIFVLISACVSPYNVTTEYQPSITISGLITDQPGPYVVTVSKAIPIDMEGEVSDALSGALVVISDDAGNSEVLIEQAKGNYYTSSFQGVIGRTYSISVTTSEGYVYQSAPETLNPVGGFSNITYEFQQNEPSSSNDQKTSSNGFNVYIDSEVLPTQQQRVWWRWNGTFHFFTYPSLRVKPVSRGNRTVLIPDPPPCSGYIVDKEALEQVGPCTCCDCWTTVYNQTPIISDPNFISNGKISHFNVAFVEVNRRSFYDKYYLEIEQLSVSETVYNFWKSIKTQKENSNNLFQIPPQKPVGNITALSKGSLPVIGYFAASASVKHTLFFDQSALPSSYRLLQIDTIANSCLGVYGNTTNVKPSFW